MQLVSYLDARTVDKRHRSSRSWLSKSTASKELLAVTSDRAQMPSAFHFLCYLNADTHTSGARTAALHADLERALRANMHILLVHETRPEANGTTFKSIIDATPEKLKWDAESAKKRLYKELAIMIAGSGEAGSEHLNVGLHLLLKAISASPVKPVLQMDMVDDDDGVDGAEAPSPPSSNFQRPNSAWKHSALRKAVQGRTLGQRGEPSVDSTLESALQEIEILKAKNAELQAQLGSQTSAPPVAGIQPVIQPVGLTSGVPRVLSAESEPRTMRRGSSALPRRASTLPQVSEAPRRRSTLLPAPSSMPAPATITTPAGPSHRRTAIRDTQMQSDSLSVLREQEDSKLCVPGTRTSPSMCEHQRAYLAFLL